MHFILLVWLIAALDTIDASPTLNNNENASNVDFFSPDGSGPLNVDTIDIAFNSDLGSSATTTDANNFTLDPYNPGVSSTDLGLGGDLAGSDFNSNSLYPLEGSLEASCGTQTGPSGSVLRARVDGQSCRNDDTNEPLNLPLDLFTDPEAALRRFLAPKTDLEKDSSSPSAPLVPSDEPKRCTVPGFPIRCCTTTLGEYSMSELQVLYFISPPTCVPSTLPFSPLPSCFLLLFIHIDQVLIGKNHPFIIRATLLTPRPQFRIQRPVHFSMTHVVTR